jgi:hypothetical protein
MRDAFSGSMITVAIAAAAVTAAISVPVSRTSAQAPAASGPVLKTSWGEPDLQGIWTDEFDTPLQRPARFANQELFTAAQREELDRQRGVLFGSDPRQARGTSVDVGGAYNTAFLTIKHAGARTSLIVDPPNGRIPPLTPEAQKAAAADRDFRLALLQSTDACKNQEPVCAGGKYDPTPSPRFSEPPPRYHAGNFVRFNRSDGPEDDGLADRCLHSGLPDFGSLFGGSFRRIVQTPGGISMFYDLNQGQGWQRIARDQRRLNTRSRSKIRPCGPRPGRSGRSSRSRVTRRTEFITSRAASKAITACRGSCMDGASKSALSPRAAVPIREPRTMSAACCPFNRIRCSSASTHGRRCDASKSTRRSSTDAAPRRVTSAAASPFEP